MSNKKPTKRKKSQALIRMDSLVKDYVLGDVVTNVLKGIHLEIKEGEFVAIMGPSGSGKSTLMNIMGFLDRPTTGEYHLNGFQMGKLSDSDLARIRNKEIGFVFQQFNLLSRLSAKENVSLPLIYGGVHSAEEREKRACAALTKVGLGHRLNNKPNELSGGEQQRVSIARAIINNPSIILADEPTGALDTKTSREVLDIFKKLNKEEGRTIIMITHEPSIADQAQRAIHIRDGLIEKGTYNK